MPADRPCLAHCEKLVADGADMLDIGGESTRPGSRPLPLEEELARVLPVVREAVRLGVPVSVDTYKPEVMRAVLDLGADIINDIWALRQPGAASGRGAHASCGVCLMHMHREPQPCRRSRWRAMCAPGAVRLSARARPGVAGAGGGRDRIVLDPGIGFGKTVPQNFSLLARQERVAAGRLPAAGGLVAQVVAGQLSAPRWPIWPPWTCRRLVPSVAAALLAVERGARIVRVHDVRETRRWPC
jgi:dihydropteroate synthase